MRQQQALSFNSNSNLPHGVKIIGQTYVLFEGANYSERTSAKDIVVIIPTGTSIQGLNEIVFSLHDALPSATGTITVSSASVSESIKVNEIGMIEEI